MKGFTLIELLVVVLIIGILSAVALPQYTKAVEKSRAAQAFAVLKSVAEAQQSYYMANGTYAKFFDELDIDLPWSGTEKWYSNATDTRSNGEWSVQLLGDSGAKGVYIGRLKGKYKGGGFGFFLESSGYQENILSCMERTAAGVIFEQNAGNYCQKIFGGVFVYQGQSGARQYRLP